MVDPAGLKSLSAPRRFVPSRRSSRSRARSGLSAETPRTSAELAKQLLSLATDSVVLVAGHSNTVPAMIEALGVAPPAPVIGEQEFDNLFMRHSGPTSAPDPAAPEYGNPSQ